jgi:hypothetical protein
MVDEEGDGTHVFLGNFEKLVFTCRIFFWDRRSRTDGSEVGNSRKLKKWQRYQLVRKVRATHHVLYAWNISFTPSCRACIFSKVHPFSAWFHHFLDTKKIIFHNHVCSCCRYHASIILRIHSSIRDLFYKSRYAVFQSSSRTTRYTIWVWFWSELRCQKWLFG